MDEWMTMINQLAAGETAQVVKDVQNIIQTSMIPVIVILVAGLLVCFFGLKLVRFFATLAGICLGAAVGASVSWTVGLQGTLFLVAVAAGAVVIGCLAAVLRRVGVFLFILLLAAGTMENILVPENILLHIICLGTGLIVAIITAVWMDPIIIVITGVGGGLLAGVAAAVLAGMENSILLTYAAGVVFAILGMVVQFMMKSREVGRKEKRYSQAVKEEKSMETEVEKARMLLDDGFENETEESESGEETEADSIEPEKESDKTE